MFAIRYLVTAIVATIAVYFLAPRLWEFYQETDFEDVVSFSESEKEERQSVVKYTPVPSSEKIERRTYGEVGTSEVAPNGVPKAQKSESKQECAEKTRETKNLRSIDVIPESGVEILRWGVVCGDVDFYRPTGQVMQKKLGGGTLVEIYDSVSTKKGTEMARCQLWDGKAWQGPYLVAVTELIMFEGGRGEILAADIRALMDFYQTKSQLTYRKSELDHKAIDANPYAEKLRKMTAEYNANGEKVATLQKERDAKTGAERIKIADELRKLEKIQTEQSQELKMQVDRYNKWKEQNPIKPADYSKDAHYVELEKKMEKLRPAIAMFDIAYE